MPLVALRPNVAAQGCITMIDIELFLRERYPNFWQRHPYLNRPLLRVLRLLFHEKLFHDFADQYPHLEGFDFVDEMLRYFDFSYRVSDRELEQIPVRGRVVVVANHPIGSLDGLALIKLMRSIRRDVKVVANDILDNIPPLRSLLIPVNNMGGVTARRSLEALHQHLDDEGALIIFPAGEVSRLGTRGIRDCEWRSGFIRLAAQSRAPVLPIFVNGRNSAFFYSLSLLARPLSTLWLVREMFHHANNCVEMRIGAPISYQSYQRVELPLKEKAKLFRRHVYRLGQGKSGVFPAEPAIAHPEDRALLRTEVRACELLGRTQDDKQIYLFRYQSDSAIMREIGRLRETAFRAVGEGSGLPRDIDKYDRHYLHLVLWDDNDLEIAGAYRLCDASVAADRLGEEHLYSATLFQYQPEMRPYMQQGLELGRSFVQPRYWGRRSLEYLWYGLGAFLRQNPQYRYLFGPASLSAAYPPRAQHLLTHFYRTHFPAPAQLARPRQPFVIPPHVSEELREKFPGASYNGEFAQLKSELMHMNLSVPTLYKQYSEICEPGGAQFVDFNVDPAFGNCIDGLIVVDLARLKPARRERYLGS